MTSELSNRVRGTGLVLFLLTMGLMSEVETAHAGEPDSLVAHSLEFAAIQLTNTVAEVGDPTRYPRSTLSDGTWMTKSSSSWTSGFAPGCLWMMYEWTLDDSLRQWAEEWTAGLEDEKDDTGTHDIGFKIFSSFGNGYRITGAPAYREVILEAAASLATRYNSTVGCIRSWDNRTFPVIIDNMMNLELLLWGARNGGDETWYDMAVSHASRTRDEHVRPDGSTYQIVDFDPDTGEVLAKEAHQGHSVESTWSRGQAWGVYGFTMAYRETGISSFLETAQLVADYFVDHLPADHVPYWDFEAPDIPDEERDTSAAAIAASGLLELATMVSDAPTEERYFRAASDILISLGSSAYLAEGSPSSGLLLHGVGNRPRGSEVDVSLIYGDYYFLEALIRYSTELEVGVTVGAGTDDGFRLLPGRPNPFRDGTIFRYDVPRRSHLAISVYDVSGRRVRTLVNESEPRGVRSLRWDGRDEAGQRVGSGVYFLRLQAPGTVLSQRVTIAR